jgi:RNA polymerase sigma factor (sigma-70 family)
MAPSDKSASDSDRTWPLIRQRILASAKSHFSPDDAEDLTQQTMVVLMERYADRPIEDLLALGLQVLTRLRLHQLSSYKRRSEEGDPRVEELLDSDQSPEQAVLNQERAAILAKAIGKLGEPCRDLLLHWMRGDASEVIRDKLGFSSTTAVHVALSRCKNKLRDIVSSEVGPV